MTAREHHIDIVMGHRLSRVSLQFKNTVHLNFILLLLASNLNCSIFSPIQNSNFSGTQCETEANLGII